jgi:hypothetical protein
VAHQEQQVLWDQWRQRIKRQQDSGLSIAEFCRREDVSSPSFSVWRRKLRQTAGRQGLPAKATQRRSGERRSPAPRPQRRSVLVAPAARPCPRNFLQLPVTSSPPAAWTELALADGTVVRLPQQNIAALIAVLHVLRGEPCDLPSVER